MVCSNCKKRDICVHLDGLCPECACDNLDIRTTYGHCIYCNLFEDKHEENWDSWVEIAKRSSKIGFLAAKDYLEGVDFDGELELNKDCKNLNLEDYPENKYVNLARVYMASYLRMKQIKEFTLKKKIGKNKITYY